MNNSESNSPNQTRLQYKIVLLGDNGVGKTALIRRYCYNDFSPDTQSTIGLRFHYTILQALQNDEQFGIGLSIWDFGGQERFRPILPQFITGANAALLVFDLTSMQAFVDLKEWYQLLVANAGTIPIDLIGSKSDLIEENPDSRVDSEYIDQYRQELRALHYLETSAKEAINTDKLFSPLIQVVVDQNYPDSKITIL
jgi:small GTP-binding protein